ncbi:MAG TPA: MarR family transcriptional regulator [Candidatus Paceibacterota bacterium]|nr:MarR family transcriptional regulator [Candidatus Paceibacterota bacterium]
MKTKTKKTSLDGLLLEFRQAITDSLFEEAKRLKIPLSQFEVLTNILKSGSITMKKVASVLNITPPSASALVDTLEKKKLVSRVQLNGDRRTTHVILGKEAQKLFASIHKRKMLFFKKALEGLSKKDKEDLTRILMKCVRN